MENSTESKPNLLKELDQRQNEVLHELDALNAKIEAVLNGWQAGEDRPNEPPLRDAA
jgi:hypothetical protein